MRVIHEAVLHIPPLLWALIAAVIFLLVAVIWLMRRMAIVEDDLVTMERHILSLDDRMEKGR